MKLLIDALRRRLTKHTSSKRRREYNSAMQ